SVDFNLKCAQPAACWHTTSWVLSDKNERSERRSPSLSELSAKTCQLCDFITRHAPLTKCGSLNWKARCPFATSRYWGAFLPLRVSSVPRAEALIFGLIVQTPTTSAGA